MDIRQLRWRHFSGWLPLALMILLAVPFITHSAGFGLGGLGSDLSGQTYLFADGGWISNPAIFGHMLTGAAITFLAPLQLMTPLRARFPAVHRWSGRLLCALAVMTAVGGLLYIFLRQTIGGPLMDFAFAAYGFCVLVAAVQTVRFARARNFARHREWALRMFVLAIGSWLYRVQYQVWYLATGGLWMEPGFAGPFDIFQLFAFYVPYLLGLEIYFRTSRAAEVRPTTA